MKSCPKAHCTYPICDCVTDENVPLLRTDQPAPTPRTLEAALECAVETARTSARNDNGTWFLKVHGTDLLNALRELSAKTTEAERLREALFYAAVTFRQINEGKHDPFSFDPKSNMRSAAGHALEKTHAALAATRKDDSNG